MWFVCGLFYILEYFMLNDRCDGVVCQAPTAFKWSWHPVLVLGTWGDSSMLRAYTGRAGAHDTNKPYYTDSRGAYLKTVRSGQGNGASLYGANQSSSRANVFHTAAIFLSRS